MIYIRRYMINFGLKEYQRAQLVMQNHLEGTRPNNLMIYYCKYNRRECTSRGPTSSSKVVSNSVDIIRNKCSIFTSFHTSPVEIDVERRISTVKKRHHPYKKKSTFDLTSDSSKCISHSSSRFLSNEFALTYLGGLSILRGEIRNRIQLILDAFSLFV